MYKTIIVLILLLYFMRRSRDAFLLFPSKELKFTPLDIGIEYIDTTVSDGDLSVNIWYIPRGKSTFLVSHGNTGNMGSRIELLTFLTRYFPSHSILFYDYPMFGKSMTSSNKKSVDACIASSKLCWAYLTKQKQTLASDITLWGESLGCYITTELALTVKPKGLILVSSFSSLGDMISDRIPVIGEWAKYLFINDLNVLENLKKFQHLKKPIVLLHSPMDAIVPYRQSITLRSYVDKWIDLEGGHVSFVLDETIAKEISQFV